MMAWLARVSTKEAWKKDSAFTGSQPSSLLCMSNSSCAVLGPQPSFTGSVTGWFSFSSTFKKHLIKKSADKNLSPRYWNGRCPAASGHRSAPLPSSTLSSPQNKPRALTSSAIKILPLSERQNSYSATNLSRLRSGQLTCAKRTTRAALSGNSMCFE